METVLNATDTMRETIPETPPIETVGAPPYTPPSHSKPIEDIFPTTTPPTAVEWDAELAALDRIDPSQFTDGKVSDRYKTVLHSELLRTLQDELDSKGMAWDRSRICVLEHGAVMVSGYRLTDFEPTAVAYIRNSYNRKYAISIAVGMLTRAGIRLLGDYQPLYQRHTSGLDLPAAMRKAVMDIPDQYNDGVSTYIEPMEKTVVDGFQSVTSRDILWRIFVQDKSLPVSWLTKVWDDIRHIGLTDRPGRPLTLLDVHDSMLARVRFDLSLIGAVNRAQNILALLSQDIDRTVFLQDQG